MNEISHAETLPTVTSVNERLKSLDAYRGLIMVILAFGGFGLAGTAGIQLNANPNSQFWATVQNQFVHAQWAGCRFWDMIQPSFMFMVGVNSIVMYCMSHQLKPWVGTTLKMWLGQDIFRVLGKPWEPTVRSTMIGLVFWLICYWLYRRKIFIRV